jgi:hypothetical protein
VQGEQWKRGRIEQVLGGTEDNLFPGGRGADHHHGAPQCLSHERCESQDISVAGD